MNNIQRFINSKLSSNHREKSRRIHEFKRLILNMPYTDTYYHYQKNPGQFFEEEEFENRSKKVFK